MLLSLSSILTGNAGLRKHTIHMEGALWTFQVMQHLHTTACFWCVCATLGNENLVFLKTAIYNMSVVKSNLPHISQQFYFRHFSLQTALVHFFRNRLYTSIF